MILLDSAPGNFARDLFQEAFQTAIAPSVSIAYGLLRFLMSGIAVLADQFLRVLPNRLFHLLRKLAAENRPGA
jgi:hypothetical protein